MTCPACHTVNPEGARFCLACGTALTAARPVEGERKFATVLFADVVGSTTLAEAIDPEAWAEVMNGAFGFMNAAIARYGGTVGRLMGDGVLAFFGAPVAQEDHAERALRAGLDLQRGAEAYAQGVAEAHGAAFRLRVGVATGLVVFATVGDAAKAEYTALGDAANVAARLQGAADPGRVWAAAETYALARGTFEARDLGTVPAKGKTRPVHAFEILSVRRQPQREADPSALDAPLIGRDRELERLAALVRGASGGRGGLALVLGEAGVGKSRLLAEVRRAGGDAAADVRWHEGRAVSFGGSLSYHPWRALLRSLLELPDGDATGMDALRAAARTLGLDDAHVTTLASLLLVQGPGEAPARREDAGDFAAHAAAAVRALLAAAAETAPRVLLLEDLHWADAASVDLLLRVADVSASGPVVIVASARPHPRERTERLLAGLRERAAARLEEVRLPPLGEGDAGALLEAFVDVGTLPAALRDAILRKTDGNPYFLEEVVRDLVDGGHLVRSGATLRATGAAVDVMIPDTLLGVLSARLDRLPADAKRVAQTAAVIGRTFPLGVLSEVCARAPEPERIEPVVPQLDVLAREELVRGLPQEAAYRFKHALSHDAAYDSLLQRRRRELHRRTAEVLAQAPGPIGGDAAAMLAHHYLRAEAWEEGALYASMAATQARRLFALEDAFGFASQAVEALERVPDPPARSFGLAVLTWVELALARRVQEDLERRPMIFARLERAEVLARQLGDPTLVADLLAVHGSVYSLSGFPDEGYRFLLEASALEAESGRAPLVLLSHFYAAEMLTARDPARAVRQFDEVIALARRDGNHGFEAHAFAMKALALARMGRYGASREAVAAALELAPSSGSTIKEADVYMVSALVFYEHGELERGLEYGTRGLDLALSVEGLECAVAGYFVAGQGELVAQHLPDAVRAFRECRRLGEVTGGMELYVNLADAGRALAGLQAGDAEARAGLREAREGAREIGDDFGFALLSMELARDALTRGAADEARALLEPALRHYREVDLRPYLARALELHAGVEEALGRAPGAEAARAEATTLRDALQRERA